MWGCVKHPDTWTSGDNTSMSSAACPPGGGGGGHLSSRLLSQRRHCGQHCGPSFSPPSLPAPLSPSTAKLTLHNEEQAGVRAQRAFQECRVPCPGGPESGSWGPLAAQVRGCKFCDAQLTSPQGHSEGTWGGGRRAWSRDGVGRAGGTVATARQASIMLGALCVLFQRLHKSPRKRGPPSTHWTDGDTGGRRG